MKTVISAILLLSVAAVGHSATRAKPHKPRPSPIKSVFLAGGGVWLGQKYEGNGPYHMTTSAEQTIGENDVDRVPFGTVVGECNAHQSDECFDKVRKPSESHIGKK